MSERPRSRRTDGTPANLSPRRIAFEVLTAVRADDAYANLELARHTKGLSSRDAAFTTELTAGTLRMQGAYDAVIDLLVPGRLDPPVRDALRLGAHQVLSMRVPTHAAVGTTVALVKQAIGHRPSGLVNAVLRKIAARDFEGWMAELGAGVAVRTSHPQWIVDAIAEARAGDPRTVLEADNVAPRVTLVARPGLARVDELPGTRMPISPYAVQHSGGDPAAVPAVREGRAGVQDAGSQLMAIALARAEVSTGERGETWLDVCAGPGGKAALLQALAQEQGAELLASELQPHRALLVRRAGVRWVVAADGTRPAWGRRFDRVLVDAPCSGLGALRRRPEARWRKQPADLEGLVPLQRDLLHAAIESTRSGGVVAYATCSPVVAETVGVVEDVLAQRPDAVLEAAVDLLPWVQDAESLTLPGAVQLWPDRHGTDAMFLAIVRVL